MAVTGVIHHIGSFFLLAAAVLLLITTISAPVIGDIGMLKVTLTNTSNLRNSSVTFGTFGHCILDVAPAQTDQDYCYKKVIGYNPAKIMEEIDHVEYNSAAINTSKALTRLMILHPIVCGLAFIAFLLALGAGIVGSFLSAIVAAFTWIITVIVMATDFTLFGIIKDHVNKDGSGSHAKFAIGMWTILAAMILLFFATFIVFFSCFSARMHKKNARASKHADAGYANGTTTTTHKRRFWQRRSNY